jgi:hypothetical protein
VDSSVKYSSSAVDTLAIFYQVPSFWLEVKRKVMRLKIESWIVFVHKHRHT